MRWILAILLAALAAPSGAQDRRAPDLAAASNFGQGLPPGLLEGALALGIDDFRDAVYWDRVEGPGGRFDFSAARDAYPDRLSRLSLTVNNGHPLYDDGETPSSAEAVAAFGRHAARTVARFPSIDAVEVGNEVNSANFVSGPLRDGTLAERAEGYTALLESTARQVRAARPGVRILGGGLHSVPTGYAALLAEAGAFAWMDALAFHPYDTPPEILPAQVARLRRLPGLGSMPLEITEYGTPDAAEAPGLMWRMHCMAALSGVTRLAWYPLHPRGDGFAPLLERDGTATALGRSFAFLGGFSGLPAVGAAPDAFARGCRYGEAATVLWGLPRTVTLPEGARAVTLGGAPRPGRSFTLAETEPLVVLGPAPALGPADALADSFLQFGYPGAGFERLARWPGGEAALSAMPGQGRPGVPWVPYLGLAADPGLRLLSETLLPSGGGDRPVAIVHRFTAPEAMDAALDLTLSPAARSVDGVRLTVTVDGAPRHAAVVTGPLREDLDLVLPRGAVLDITVGPGATARGDVTAYRFTLRRR